MYEEEECNEDEEGIIVSNATSVAKLVRKNRSVLSVWDPLSRNGVRLHRWMSAVVWCVQAGDGGGGFGVFCACSDDLRLGT